MKIRQLGILFLPMVIAGSLACDDDAGIYTAEDLGLSDTLTGEGMVLDLRLDATQDSALDRGLDGAQPGPDRKDGEVASGAALSSGSSYELFSLVGSWRQPLELKGNTFTLTLSPIQ